MMKSVLTLLTVLLPAALSSSQVVASSPCKAFLCAKSGGPCWTMSNEFCIAEPLSPLILTGAPIGTPIVYTGLVDNCAGTGDKQLCTTLSYTSGIDQQFCIESEREFAVEVGGEATCPIGVEASTSGSIQYCSSIGQAGLATVTACADPGERVQIILRRELVPVQIIQPFRYKLRVQYDWNSTPKGFPDAFCDDPPATTSFCSVWRCGQDSTTVTTHAWRTTSRVEPLPCPDMSAPNITVWDDEVLPDPSDLVGTPVTPGA